MEVKVKKIEQALPDGEKHAGWLNTICTGTPFVAS